LQEESKKPRTDKEDSRTRPAAAAKMKFADAHALKVLPEKIAAAELEIARLEESLADPQLFSRDHKRFAALSAKMADIRAQKDADEERWLALEMEREALGS
jgi:ATP-binding cassette subfamily F protein uup